MFEPIEPKDIFTKGSVVVRRLSFLALLVQSLKETGIEIAALGIVIGLILNRGEHFVLASLCLTTLGVAKVIALSLEKYAEITVYEKQNSFES